MKGDDFDRNIVGQFGGNVAKQIFRTAPRFSTAEGSFMCAASSTCVWSFDSSLTEGLGGQFDVLCHAQFSIVSSPTGPSERREVA